MSLLRKVFLGAPALLLLLCLPALLEAQGYKTGAVQSVLKVSPTASCANGTWYYPTVFTYPNGDLAMAAQSGRTPGSTCPAQSMIDDIYSARRSVTTGTWTIPSSSACPTLKGGYSRCGYSYPMNPGAISSPSVVKVGSTYYMAFNGGNADYIVGRLYWATSTDGVTWSVYNVNPPTGEVWAPLMAPKYHECLDGRPAGQANGIAGPYLAYDASDTSMGPNGTFYVYFSHWGLRPDLSYGGFLDNWAIRFAYQPTSPFGIGTSKQIWHRITQNDGTWKSFNSGLMVWDYDVNSGLQAIAGEPVLTAFQGENMSGRFGFGDGDLQRDPLTGQWLHLYEIFGTVYVQSAPSLASNLWSSPVEMDMTTVRNLVPAGTSPSLALPYGPAMYYGAGGNRTGWWIYTPINHLGCASAFWGLGIAPAEMCTTALPTISSISPAAGSTAGGNQVTISGSNLDCVSAVTFGGTSAPIVSRTYNQVRVTAPARAAGAVQVAVTTPAGTAALNNGYTYVAVRLIWLQPQALAGFGTPGSLVMAGSATGAVSGSQVQMSWRDLTTGGLWVTEPYAPLPDANGIWYHEILNANTSHRYEVKATYGGVTSVSCTYPGTGALYWCP